MRWLFLIMLVLNLSYVAWGMLNTSKQDVLVSAPPLPDVPTILLANEGEGANAPVKGDAQAQYGVGAGVGGEPVDTALSEDGGETEKRRLGMESEALLQQAGVDVEVSAPEVMEPVATEATQISLAGVDSGNEGKQAGDSQEKDDAQIKIPDTCFTLGPFRELDALRALTRNIKEYVADVGFRSRDEEESSLFWVYLSPLESRGQAKEVGEQLKAKKIKDFYIIRSGEKANGLSLGQFRNKGGAYRLAKKVTKLGFAVEVEPIFKTYTLYWLDYRLIAGGSIPETVTADYLTGEISRLSRSCDQLVSESF